MTPSVRAAARAPLPAMAPATVHPRPRVVELVGLAGAGKSTVLHTLARCRPNLQAGLRVRTVRHLPLLIANTAALLPVLRGLDGCARRTWWTNVRYAVRLATLPVLVRRAVASSPKTLVLEEGPVFTLAMLRPCLETAGLQQRWHQALDHWATMVDAIVWLDASDGVLARRIRSRPKHHVVKAATDQAINEFLARHRSAYQEVIAQLAARGGPPTIVLSTERDSLAQVVEKILGALESVGR